MSEREVRYAEAIWDAALLPLGRLIPNPGLLVRVMAVADAEQAELRAENDRIWAEVEKHLAEIERLRADLRQPGDQCKTAKDTGSCDQCHDHIGRHKPCRVPDA